MGREPRSVHQRAGGSRSPPAPQDRRRVRREAHSHVAGRRVSAGPVTRNGERPIPIPQSLNRLRFRLTAWYAVTFLVVLLLLGVGLFATVTRYFDRDLDASLRDATT